MENWIKGITFLSFMKIECLINVFKHNEILCIKRRERQVGGFLNFAFHFQDIKGSSLITIVCLILDYRKATARY